uniref:Uncharacterized protein n=1 Tax=Bionectria ochroleuca TaxID=29856 RepID=A0A8H7MYH5_BIOOC
MGSKPGSAMSTQDRATYARAGATIAHHDVNMRQPEDVLAGLRELMAQTLKSTLLVCVDQTLLGENHRLFLAQYGMFTTIGFEIINGSMTLGGTHKIRVNLN